MAPIPLFTLNSGTKIPAVGFGTWGGFDKEFFPAVKDVVLSALKAGHRHLDGAWMYETEKYVGEAIRESGIPREDIFITTKLSWIHHGHVEQSFQQSLTALGVDYVDLFLIHWPHSFVYEGDHKIFPRDSDGKWKLDDSITFAQSWAALENIYASGRAKAIGVSNFSVKTLEELLKTAKVIPAVNQVELHPYLAQEGLREYCDKKGIHITAYTSTGWGPVREDPVILRLAEKYKSSPAQITLAWHIARRVSPCTRSTQPERQEQSLDLPTLDDADIELINGLDRNQRLCSAPDANGEVNGWSMERLGW